MNIADLKEAYGEQEQGEAEVEVKAEEPEQTMTTEDFQRMAALSGLPEAAGWASLVDVLAGFEHDATEALVQAQSMTDVAVLQSRIQTIRLVVGLPGQARERIVKDQAEGEAARTEK